VERTELAQSLPHASMPFSLYPPLKDQNPLDGMPAEGYRVCKYWEPEGTEKVKEPNQQMWNLLPRKEPDMDGLFRKAIPLGVVLLLPLSSAGLAASPMESKRVLVLYSLERGAPGP
jgi:hypothetical protein